MQVPKGCPSTCKSVKKTRISFMFYIFMKYREISNIRRTKSPNLIVPCLALQLSLPNPVKPGVRSRMSSADRRCSNYIWVIDNFIAYKGASYIRDLTGSKKSHCVELCFVLMWISYWLIILAYCFVGDNFTCTRNETRKNVDKWVLGTHSNVQTIIITGTYALK